MATLFQIIVFIVILIVLIKKYHQSQKSHLILVMVSGSLIILLKLIPAQMQASWMVQCLATLTLGLCCLSGWLIIKNQK